MDIYDIIMNAEEQFAREVTLGVIVTRPLTAWHYMIPGFFIVDFLRRGSAIRKYTQYFMFPRKIAMDAALAVPRQEDKETLNSRIREDISRWLESLNLYTLDLVQAHIELIGHLAEHYLKLLNSDGDTINLLIEHAYQHRDDFKQYIETITSAENKVESQLIEQIGDKENAKEKILAEQQQIAKRRQKILEDVF